MVLMAQFRFFPRMPRNFLLTAILCRPLGYQSSTIDSRWVIAYGLSPRQVQPEMENGQQERTKKVMSRKHTMLMTARDDLLITTTPSRKLQSLGYAIQRTIIIAAGRFSTPKLNFTRSAGGSVPAPRKPNHATKNTPN